METLDIVIGVAVLILLAGVGAIAGLVRPRRRRRSLPPREARQAGGPVLGPRSDTDPLPGVGDDAEVPRDSPSRAVDVVELPEEPAGPERPAPVGGRLVRLRERLARSNSALGQGLLALLSRDTLDESTWEEVEETLLLADVGVGPTTEIVDHLRERVRVLGTREPARLKELLREELLAAVGADVDRSLATERHGERPAVVLVVGVNGTGKTTTVGKLARVLVAQDKDVVLGAADTFRAAAAEQLATWGERVGVPTVRSEKDGADPASVAFDAVKAGIDADADVVLVDTAGRLQNKAGLMDELGKVKRVLERHGPVDEVLLVLDATTGQNGLRQAAVFSEVVHVSGIVLTKLDGTAKGGIVVAVQRQLGVPVKLIGLGEGPDDLAPFEAEAFVDALLS
ncbi:signal recognition particle-docking protein FtsY [Paenibacillus sp. TRM 82003]|uniref:signal recognition particle-docking protein FtsY n=1 Tax=Kineococcus sp. TRM81007 TaxID=2925831 RepID=UPI001F5947C7|nr:signal recognition particle-docking protein FtsY [Kineococcus sp. TRM81007]MCI2240218.1 signal recognition particle-docking protein FtsY [Kineococcus sp. TRM81007]MCI3927604.1 signal recognition particle-docking protein FtsY [Paenibacillus sp. TRM 82003]